MHEIGVKFCTALADIVLLFCIVTERVVDAVLRPQQQRCLPRVEFRDLVKLVARRGESLKVAFIEQCLKLNATDAAWASSMNWLRDGWSFYPAKVERETSHDRSSSLIKS